MVDTALDLDNVDKIVNKYKADPNMLIQILLEIQREHRWLPSEALKRVSERLKVPSTRIYQIATFYKAFSLTPKGRHECVICTGTACHVRGSPRLLDRAQQVLGIEPDQITPDQKFSLETVNCLGCCALGPVLVVDGKYYGKVPVSQIAEIIKKYD
jgi:NADH-quinone oxidoreductase subunit E